MTCESPPIRRRPLGDISNTPPARKHTSPVPKLLSPTADESVPKLTPARKGLPSSHEDNPIQPVSSPPCHGGAAAVTPPRTLLQQSESFLSEDVQLTPPECKAMLNAINSAVDAEDRGASEMPDSLEGWLQQVGITDTVSDTLKEQLQILYDRACESARLRSFMEAMKINELEMAAHEADDTARQMDLLADENTFLYESKSTLMSDNEVLRRQLQEAQARLESRVELQMQVQLQQQQQQQQQGQPHLLLEPSSTHAQQQGMQQKQQQQQRQQEQQAHLAPGQGRAILPPVPPTPALIHTPAMTQATRLAGTPAWVTTRQGPFAPSPGLSALSIRTPSLDETEAWMQLDASFAAQRALTPLETPSLQDALAWVDGPNAHSAHPRAHTAFGSPQSALCPAANDNDSPAGQAAGRAPGTGAGRTGTGTGTPSSAAASGTDAGGTGTGAGTPSSAAAPGTGTVPPVDPLPSQLTLRQACAATLSSAADPGTGTAPPMNQLTFAPGTGAVPSMNQLPSQLTFAHAAAPSSAAAPATAGAADAAQEGRLAAHPVGTPAPDLGAVLPPAEQMGSSSMDTAAAARSAVALGESSSVGTPAGSAPQPQPWPATAEEPGVDVSLYQLRPTTAEEPGVDVSLLGDQKAVHLCVTPLAHGKPHGPFPDAQGLGVSSMHACSIHAHPAATSPPFPSSSPPVQHPRSETPPPPHVSQNQAGDRTPSLQAPELSPALADNAINPAMASNATSPWAALQPAAPSPSAHGSEISFGSCGAVGFASASMGSMAGRLQRALPDFAGAEDDQGAGGNKCTASHSPSTAATGTQDMAAAAAPRTRSAQISTDQLEASIQPAGEGLPAAQISTQDTVHSTPCVSAQFATPLGGGSVAFQTPLSGRASFQTGASAFASATRSVTSKPPANAWDGNRFDAASALSFSTPSVHPCEPATSTAAMHNSSNTDANTDFATPIPTQPREEACPPPPSAPHAAPPPVPFAAAFFNAFSAAFESAPTPAPPTFTKARDTDAASPLCSPAAGGLRVNVAQATPPAEATSPPFRPNHSPAGSLGEAAGKVGNSAWALLCSDEEEEEREEGRGMSEAEAAVDGTQAGAVLHAAASNTQKVEAVSALHATACSPEKEDAGPVLHTTEPDSQHQVPAQPTPAHQQDAAAAQESTLGTAQDCTPDEAAWGVLHYQTPGLSASQAGDHATPPSQAATYPPKPLACPWGPQQGCQSASPTLQHRAHHPSEGSTSSGSIGSGGSARYKPLCLNWCGAPSTQSRGLPGGPVRVHSAASTPSTQDMNSLGVQELCSDAESRQAVQPLRLDTSTPSRAASEQAAMQPQRALLAKVEQQGVCPAGPATPANMSEAAAGVADAVQALPEQAGGVHAALALDLTVTADRGREAAAQLSPACPDRLHLTAAAGMAATAAKDPIIKGAALPMQRSGGGAAVRANANEQDSHASSTQVSPPEAASGPDEGAAGVDGDCIPSRDQQTNRSSRWGRRMTEEQEKEVRRRAAALKIHISPYFKGSQSRRAAAPAAYDGQDV